MNFVVILAAGNGTRISNSEKPKQFLMVNGVTILGRVVSLFSSLKVIDEIVIVSQKDFFPFIEEIIIKDKLLKPIHLVEGGSTRQLSSFNAINFLTKRARKDDFVAIHDCARVLVSKKIIESGFEILKTSLAATTSLKTIDSLVQSTDGQTIDQYVDRKTFYQLQTPQFFHFHILQKAHNKAQIEGFTNSTDDSVLVQNLDIKVALINGDPSNFKVTTNEDLVFLEKLLSLEK